MGDPEHIREPIKVVLEVIEETLMQVEPDRNYKLCLAGYCEYCSLETDYKDSNGKPIPCLCCNYGSAGVFDFYEHIGRCPLGAWERRPFPISNLKDDAELKQTDKPAKPS